VSYNSEGVLRVLLPDLLFEGKGEEIFYARRQVSVPLAGKEKERVEGPNYFVRGREKEKKEKGGRGKSERGAI